MGLFLYKPYVLAATDETEVHSGQLNVADNEADKSIAQWQDGAFPTDSCYVAAVRFNTHTLVDYYDLVMAEDETLFLPAEEIFRGGEASSSVEVDRLLLTVASTGNSLLIDRAQGVLEINGISRPLRQQDFRDMGGSFLVSDRLLAETFQLESTFNPSTQELLVKSARPFPRDLRIAREHLWDVLYAADTLTVPVNLQEQDYSMLGSPQADISLSGLYNNNSDPTGNWNALVVSEALYLTNHLYTSGNINEPLANLRLRSGRMSPTGGVFGIEHLYDVQAGDISGLRMPLVGSGGSGRGVRLQATPPGHATNFDKTLVEGDSPAGWDVELYLGSTLLDFQRVGSDGRYRFDNVPLDYGMNELKVVLYGPQGQVREERFRQQIGATMVPPGQVYGAVYVVQDGSALFADESSLETSADTSWTGGVKADIGVFQRLTVGVFAARSPSSASSTAVTDTLSDDQAVDDYFGVELRPSLGSLNLLAGAAGRAQGGSAGYARLSMPLYGTSISASYQYYDQLYRSKDNEYGLLSSETDLRFSIPLGPKELKLGSLGVSLENQQRWNSDPEWKTELSYGHQLGAVSLGHKAELSWNGDSGDISSATGTYTLRSSYSKDLFDIRGEASYGLGDVNRLQAITLTGLWRKDDRNQISTNLSYSPDSQTTSYGMAWSHDLGIAALSLNGSAGDNNYSLGLGLSFSFGHTPARGANMSSRFRATMGLADVQIFEDIDADGEFTQGRDKPLSGAGVLINRRTVPGSCDADGRLGFDSLSIYDPFEITVNKSSLSDIFLVPLYPAVRAWPRPGQAVEIKIPVTESGEISGFVQMAVELPVKSIGSTGGRSGNDKNTKSRDQGASAEKQRIIERPLSGIRIQVLNADGQLHAEVFSFSDGYFTFDTVYPGHWTIRLAPDQEYRTVKLAQGDVNLELTPQQRVVNDVKFNYQSNGSLRGSHGKL